jgi:glycine/D-amino acid oxidase-like deaminating enzyme
MRVAVLGAGLQGACVALELSVHGVEVDLYEKSDRCLSQTSSHNEGKMHLGYVYANDRSLRTARTMAKGSTVFQKLMRRWLGDAIDTVPVSLPFYYIVHRQSLLDVTDIDAHLRAVHRILMEESAEGSLDYFGIDYREPPQRLPDAECRALFNERWITAAYRTAEIGIDSEALAVLLRARLAADRNIHCLFGTSVMAVRMAGSTALVEFKAGEKKGRAQYDHVVNSLWDGRLTIDKTAGIEPPRPWLYRIKHYLRLRHVNNGCCLPTTTVVLGPFGDIVTYDNNEAFLSWYPAGMKGLSSDLSPPAWPLTLNYDTSLKVRNETLQALAKIVPAVARLSSEAIESCEIKAGVIFAWGSTDIPDPTSSLHERYSIGPHSFGRYHSIDTGKLTMAPYFAKMLADQILENE